jgi:hypothetical protein
MYKALSFLPYLTGVMTIVCALISAHKWNESAELPVPTVPAELLSPVLDPSGNPVPISMVDEARRRELTAITMRDALVAMKRGAVLNRSAAWAAVWSSGFAALSFTIPIVRDIGVMMKWWVKTVLPL